MVSLYLYAIAILYVSTLLKLPKKVQFIMLILIFAALFSKTLIMIIWVYLILSVGLVVYYTMSKIFGG